MEIDKLRQKMFHNVGLLRVFAECCLSVSQQSNLIEQIDKRQFFGHDSQQPLKSFTFGAQSYKTFLRTLFTNVCNKLVCLGLYCLANVCEYFQEPTLEWST
jgi:hypothetical protein